MSLYNTLIQNPKQEDLNSSKLLITLLFIYGYSLSFINNFGIFVIVVFVILAVVVCYSFYYLVYDKMLRFYFSVLFLFGFTILILLCSSNYYSLFLRWELLGLTSYFLVCFYNNSRSLVSGITTIISNRVGDVFFMVVFVCLVF